jgi:hypothetical protein
MGTPSEGARMVVLDPSAPLAERFGAQVFGDIGNLGAGILRQPGWVNWDVSVFRNIRFKERRVLELRFESYNTFNNPQFSTISPQARFASVGSTVQTDPLFLQPTATRSPRRVQIAMRFSF